MGSYDRAETCELIGAYMLSLDGMAVCTPKEIEKKKQSKTSGTYLNQMASKSQWMQTRRL